MNFRTVYIATILFLCLGSLLGLADSAESSTSAVALVDSLNAVADDNDAAVRENPVIEGSPSDDDINIAVPGYINEEANHIQMNGADWSKLRTALANSSKRPFTIVHIGDSHLQADIASGAVREFLQYDYGNAGRGLAIPFRLAGTNEPWDYTMSSNSSWNSSKILRRPWTVPMGFTGISIAPRTAESDLFVATRDDNNYNPFNSMTIFHTGNMKVQSVENRDGNRVKFSQTNVAGGTLVKLATQENGVRLRFTSENLVISGVNLSGSRPGVFYHTIGNNGATYSSYDNIEGLGSGIANLHPNLVILSVGTNDAFGRFDPPTFTRAMDRVIKEIRQANPNAEILLTTPMECQQHLGSSNKKVKKRVRVKGKNGQMRWTTKYVNSGGRSRGYGVNLNIPIVREAIQSYAQRNNIALYDWYEVAGGKNASNKWIADGFYGSDRVHHTTKGYRLNGYLLYQALSEALKSNTQKN